MPVRGVILILEVRDPLQTGHGVPPSGGKGLSGGGNETERFESPPPSIRKQSHAIHHIEKSEICIHQCGSYRGGGIVYSLGLLVGER